MRIWHTPVNYGSLPANTVRVLRAAGADAHGLFFTNNLMRADDGSKSVYGIPKSRPVGFLFSRLRWMATWMRELVALRPDIIHWYFGKSALPFGVDLMLVKRLKIPRVVEWQGSDIRTPEVEQDNPYYAAARASGYEYAAVENDQTAQARQRRFAAAGFASTAPIGMLQYINRDFFPHTHVIRQRLVLSDYTPQFPANTDRPLIVHMSTAPHAKGTPAVLRAIESLRTSYNFEFQLIQGLPRAEAYAILKRADIVLEQFVLGDFGMSALEGMAFGKPVICYIKPSLAAQYPSDLPIHNATQDNLPDVIAPLLRDPAARRASGEAGRAYMERNYQTNVLASELTAMYRSVIESSRA